MNTISLQDPSIEELRKSYRKLQRFSSLQLQCEIPNLKQTLESLEEVGFIGLKIAWPTLSNKAVEISCTKGKHGPCYDTGQTAIYTGKALAALDDDTHLLFRDREQPICLKTAEIYQSDSYTSLTQVSAPDPQKKERIKSTPILFDCDDYSDSIDHLLTLCPEITPTNSKQSIFYSGPFKALITPSGHLIRRGQWCSLPKDQAELLKSEGLLFKDHTVKDAPEVKTLIQTKGKQALLDLEFNKIQETHKTNLSSSVFRGTSEDLKEKLLHCIEQHQDYIMLVGSDPQDQLGCCPSEDVGMANQLMRAGILSKAQQEVDDNQCPIQMYAFHGELIKEEQELRFQKNDELRKQVLHYLRPSKSQNMLKWILFIFILVSLCIAFKKLGDRYRPVEQKQLFHLIQEHQLDKDSFILFHHEVRCEMCLLIEKHTREFSQKHHLHFITVNMDEAHWKKLIDDYQLFSAALFYIQPNKENSPQVKLVKDAWETWKDPNSFRDMLQQQLP